MINKLLLPKAYTEVIEILKYISKEEYIKIPSEILENMEEKRDKDYQFIVNKIDDFSEQQMLNETKTILAVLYRDYWADIEQRNKIKEKERIDLLKIEEEKREKYNPNNIFNSNIKSSEKEQQIYLTNVQEKNIFLKIIEKIKQFFKL